MHLKAACINFENSRCINFRGRPQLKNLAVALPSEAQDLLRRFMLYLESSSLVPGDPPIDLESALHS